MFILKAYKINTGRQTSFEQQGEHSPDVKLGRGVSTVPTQCNGRRILATKKDLRMRRNISCTGRGKQSMGQQNCEVSLKDKSGLLVGKGLLLSEI